MDLTSARVGELSTAQESGRTCALAAAGQRDLQKCALSYGDPFSAKPFDATLFGSVAMACAFGAPWLTATQLRIANRCALWVFGVDWLIDYLAQSSDDVDDLVCRCLAVAEGADPATGDGLTRFLADIRDELATSPNFAAYRSTWLEELRRMLHAMAREWRWKSARTADPDVTALDMTLPGVAPTFEEYLANADNFGSTFVNVTHWIFICEPDGLRHLETLLVASREVQQVLRLLNDLRTYQRDLSWADLNGLLLGLSREEVTERVGQLIEGCRQRLRDFHHDEPRLAAYLERQIGFSAGFYGSGDYWGEL
jgi:signal transduction histidine kinase